MKIVHSGNYYEKTTGTFNLYIEDPHTYTPFADTSGYSVSISDPSVAKISSVRGGGGDSLRVEVYFLKTGSADFILNYRGETVKARFTVKKTIISVPSSIALHVGDSPLLSSYVTRTGGGDITIKKLKSSNKEVVGVVGGFLIAKKTGTAKITAVINGQRKNISVTVGKKQEAKPTLSQLNVSAKGYT